MKLGIISAMEEELAPLLEAMEVESTNAKANMTFNKGKLWGKDVIAVVSGIGKVNAAICAQILASEYKVDTLINVGVAGGIGKDVYPGDVVIGDSLVEHDMDATKFGYKHGQIPRLDVFDFKSDKTLVETAKKACDSLENINSFVGRIVSGDEFVSDIDRIKWLQDTYEAISCEMEGASIAHVAYLNNIKFVVIRSISDNANNGAHMDYEKFLPIAIKNSVTILETMIKSM